MTYYQGLNNNSDQIINISAMTTLGAGETGNSIVMYGGNDTVYGSKFNDIIQGGNGNDLLKGNGGDDFLAGQGGNDWLYGGIGNDKLYGGAGNDLLNGEAGIDYLVGGAGDDTYIHSLSSGNDIINDNQTETGAVGSGGGSGDKLQFSGVAYANIVFISDGSANLYVSSANDWYSNFMVDDGVMIQNYFLGGDYKIELIAGSDNINHFFPV